MTAVVVVGSVHIDLVAAASRLPRRGESLVGHAFSTHPGGKAGNQACQVARHGVCASLVGRVGADPFGESLRAALAATGVDVTFLVTDSESATGASTVLTGEEGDYASIVVPGAGRRLGAADLAAARPAFERASLLLTQLELGPEPALLALRAGRACGLRTILNAAPAPDSAAALPEELWRAVDLLLVNRVEAATLAATTIATPDDGERAARFLAERYRVPTVVVTLGDEGAAVADGERDRHLPSHPVDVVDTIGAGDAFAGALAAALARGLDLARALELAGAAGALAVTKAGAYDALPTLEEVERFLADPTRRSTAPAGDRARRR